MVRVNFSTNGLSQKITIGTQVFTTLNNYVDVTLSVGTYSASLETINTSPIVKATASVVITKVVDNRVWSIIK